MKVNGGVAAAAIIVVLVLVGWLGWRALAPQSAPRPANLEALRRQRDPGLQMGRQPGGTTSPAPPGMAPRKGPPGMMGGRGGPMMRPAMGAPGAPMMGGNGPMPGR